MLEVDVLRQEELKRGDSEEEESEALNISQHGSSDDSVADNLNLHADKSDFISDFNSKDSLISSTPGVYVAKSKTWSNTHSQKPYDRLSEREKQRIEERRNRRAIRIRGEILRSGFSLSTIQQLRDDFSVHSNNGHRRRENSTCSIDSEDISSSFDEEDELEKDFDSWDQYLCTEEFMDYKSNFALVKDFMDKEDKIEELEKTLRNARLLSQRRTQVFDVEAELEKIRVYRKEIDNLSRENELLRTENDNLRRLLPSETLVSL